MRARRRSRRSSTATTVGDALHIANRLSWRWSIALGLILFAIFYWATPWWLTARVASLDGNRLQGAVAAVLVRRIHYVEWLGIALLIACGAIAAWKYFTNGRTLSSGAQRNVNRLSRLVGRRID
jgi:hypothetical protein